MSQRSQPSFKSKIPKPVILQRTQSNPNDVKRFKTNVTKTKTLSSFQEEKNCAKRDQVLKNGAQKIKGNGRDCTFQSVSCVERGLKEDKVEKKNEEKTENDNEFQPNARALESILSNKGITPDLLTRPSTIQSVQRSSLYYQHPSRLSLMDSHNLFKEKMKFVREQMKSLNIAGKETPKSQKEGTPTTSSARPINLYYRTPFQSSVNNVTPQSSRHLPRNMFLSEIKGCQPKDTQNSRLCSTAYKLDSKWKPHSSPSTLGKENKCRFKLFADPINESPENVSGQTNEKQACQSAFASSSHMSRSRHDPKFNDMEKVSLTQSTTIKDTIPETTLVSTSRSHKLLSQLTPSVSISMASSSSNCNTTLSSHQSRNISAVVSTPPSLCTRSANNAMYTPKIDSKSRNVLKSYNKVDQNRENSNSAVKNSIGKIQSDGANTPSRISVSSVVNKELLKPPQRTPIGQRSNKWLK